jgi:hypothetical protein
LLLLLLLAGGRLSSSAIGRRTAGCGCIAASTPLLQIALYFRNVILHFEQRIVMRIGVVGPAAAHGRGGRS